VILASRLQVKRLAEQRPITPNQKEGAPVMQYALAFSLASQAFLTRHQDFIFTTAIRVIFVFWLIRAFRIEALLVFIRQDARNKQDRWGCDELWDMYKDFMHGKGYNFWRLMIKLWISPITIIRQWNEYCIQLKRWHDLCRVKEKEEAHPMPADFRPFVVTREWYKGGDR
jgi:hypothetical protein